MQNQKILAGFIVNGAGSVYELEIVINQMRNVVQKTAESEYARLLTAEVERLVDSIAMNRVKRPENASILDAAARVTKDRILYSDRNGCETEYNLYIGCQVLLGKFLDKKENSVLLKIVAPNDIYMKPLGRVKSLIPYNVYTDEIKKGGKKEKLWADLCVQYPQDVPLASNLINYDVLSIDPKEFVYRSPEERAGLYAKENVLNRLLSQYACGGEIPPERLMEYLLKAEDRIHYQDLAAEVLKQTEDLKKILPNITYSLVSKSPLIERLAPQEEEAAPDQASEAQPSSEEAPLSADAADDKKEPDAAPDQPASAG